MVVHIATDDAEKKRNKSRLKNLQRARQIKLKEEQARKAREERQAKQNKFYETSSVRNMSWNELANQRIKTEKMNRQKELQSSKAVVMSKSKIVWPEGCKIEDTDHIQFVLMVAGINDEEHVLFQDLLLLESSLNANMCWDVLQILMKNMISKHKDNA